MRKTHFFCSIKQICTIHIDNNNNNNNNEYWKVVFLHTIDKRARNDLFSIMKFESDKTYIHTPLTHSTHTHSFRHRLSSFVPRNKFNYTVVKLAHIYILYCIVGDDKEACLFLAPHQNKQEKSEGKEAYINRIIIRIKIHIFIAYVDNQKNIFLLLGKEKLACVRASAKRQTISANNMILYYYIYYFVRH